MILGRWPGEGKARGSGGWRAGALCFLLLTGPRLGLFWPVGASLLPFALWDRFYIGVEKNAMERREKTENDLKKEI